MYGGSFKKKNLHDSLNIPAQYEILLAVALGKPNEKVVIETASKGDIKYWRDKKDVLYVPKRPIEELILEL